MNESKISVRYAKALILLAKEENLLPELAGDIRMVAVLCRDSDDFTRLLTNPLIKRVKKTDVFSLIFKEKVHPITLRFLHFVVNNGREAYLPAICRGFNELSQYVQGITPVTVTTAKPLTNDSRNRIMLQLQQKTGKTIELTEKVRTDIIGGLILRVGNIQYDGSVSCQLKKVRESLIDSGIKDFMV
jgi:F-type H+-transporting ATPase subunit delta